MTSISAPSKSRNNKSIYLEVFAFNKIFKLIVADKTEFILVGRSVTRCPGPCLSN
jgi:hypothetical protein